MGAVEHLKTLCCLGLKPESAMIAVVPLLHEIIPHGWARANLFEPNGTMGNGYSGNPEAVAHNRERLPAFAADPASPISLILGPAFRAVGIGWGLHLQGRGYLESRHYREFEAPIDSCWILDAMIGECGRSIALLQLTRPRFARPFTVDDVQRLDRLRPWLAHAFQRPLSGSAHQEDPAPIAAAGLTLLSCQLIVSSDARLVYQTSGLELLLRILAGEPADYMRPLPRRDRLSPPILKLLGQITGAANGTSNAPPRMQVSTAYGVLTLEAKWLVPSGTFPADAAKDPKSCLIAVTIELHEHAIAHAARVLRERGATPAQTKVGIQLALGKPKSAIADALGLQLSSIADHTRKLYQNLDVHNSTELATKIWLGQKQDAEKFF